MRYIQTLVIVAMMLLVSCSSYKTTLSQSADLSKYQYASVIKDDPHSPAVMVDAEIGIYDALDKSRLQSVGEQAISELSPNQKQELLMARYSSMVTEKGAIVSINFVDYYTGRPVASCQCEYSKGLDMQTDLKGAIKLITKQIVETFPKK